SVICLIKRSRSFAKILSSIIYKIPVTGKIIKNEYEYCKLINAAAAAITYEKIKNIPAGSAHTAICSGSRERNSL
ncbi:hypothetical protein, partial [Treponema pedis]|uniref:hypothetical protein n=1 Tax=Treponema pedis TaxID=409322 RepID=UPI001CEFA462